MIGDTPEDRLRRQKRTKRIRLAASVAVVILAVAIAIALLPTTPSPDLRVDKVNSLCYTEESLSCIVALEPKPGYTATVSVVRAVQINGTNAVVTDLAMARNEIQLNASVPLPQENCPPDIGCSLAPPREAQVVVLLTDGTTTSSLIDVQNGE